MADYILSCCSPADLSEEHFNRRNISYICFHFEIDGVTYEDDLGKSVPPEMLFQKMAEGAETRTSQVSVGEYTDYWRKFLEDGKDILHVCLSSGISGTYQSAVIARDDLQEEFPDRKIYVVDSLGASSGYGLFMDTLADRRDEGMNIDELYKWAEENKLRMHHWFFSTDLTYYIRGGRVSKGAGFVGQMLNICPLLNMDNLGRLIPREKIRGKKKVMKRVVEKMMEHAEGGADYSGKCYISHSLYEEDTKELAAMIEEAFPKMNGKVELYPIGGLIGSHTGPGTISTYFWGDLRVD